MSTIEQPLHVDDIGSLLANGAVVPEPRLDCVPRIVAKLKDRKLVGRLLVELGQLRRHLQRLRPTEKASALGIHTRGIGSWPGSSVLDICSLRQTSSTHVSKRGHRRMSAGAPE